MQVEVSVVNYGAVRAESHSSSHRLFSENEGGQNKGVTEYKGLVIVVAVDATRPRPAMPAPWPI